MAINGENDHVPVAVEQQNTAEAENGGNHSTLPTKQNVAQATADGHETEPVRENESLASGTPGMWYSAAHTLLELLASSAQQAAAVRQARYCVTAMVPLVVQMHEAHFPALIPVLPVLIEASGNAASILYAKQAARPLLGLMPAILNHSVEKLASLATQDKALSPEVATDILATYTELIIKKYYHTGRRSSHRDMLPQKQWDGAHDSPGY